MKPTPALFRGWPVPVWLLLAVFHLAAAPGRAATTAYYDEASYLAALAALGSPQVTESFESAAWDPARQYGGTNYIASQGINWAGGEDAIKAGTGSARTGSYVVYGWSEPGSGPSYLEGSPSPNGFPALTAVGGWFTATTATNLMVSKDTFSAPFGSVRISFTNFTFLGIINPEGFQGFAFTTTRGHWVADDFTFGVVPKPACPPPPPVVIRVSQVEVCWPSVSNVAYQVQYRSEATSNIWVRLFNTVVAKGAQSCITDNVLPGTPPRLYRIVCPGD